MSALDFSNQPLGKVPARQIASVMGCSHETVCRAVRLAGLEQFSPPVRIAVTFTILASQAQAVVSLAENSASHLSEIYRQAVEAWLRTRQGLVTQAHEHIVSGGPLPKSREAIRAPIDEPSARGRTTIEPYQVVAICMAATDRSVEPSTIWRDIVAEFLATHQS